jgi:hypothetical protein
MVSPVRSVRWGQPCLAFELCSSNASLLARASTIFRPWRDQLPVTTSYRWHIEQEGTREDGGDKYWEVRDDSNFNISTVSSERALTTVEFLAVHKLYYFHDSPLIINGAVVVREGKGVLILGPNQVGKSTLACGLWQQGWSLMCDDTTLIDVKLRTANSTPRRVSLRNSSRAFLGEELWSRISTALSSSQSNEGFLFHPDEIDDKPRPRDTELSAVIFLARRGHSVIGATLKRLEPANALLALLPYCNFVQRLDFINNGKYQAELGRVISLIGPFVESVPAYDLGRGNLSEMMKAVEQTLS